jgi:aldehyde dehydrogenase (NAD+)
MHVVEPAHRHRRHPRPFVAALMERMKKLVIDDALKPGIDIGPGGRRAQLEKNLSYVEIGQREGGRLMCGGERLKRDTDGLLHGAGAVHRDDERDATESRGSLRSRGGGDSSQGLRRSARGCQRHAVRLVVGIRDDIAETCEPLQAEFHERSRNGEPTTAGLDYHVPFGGRKKSSYGPREQGSYAKDFYTILKTAYTAP